jgi:hypothetical protein
VLVWSSLDKRAQQNKKKGAKSGKFGAKYMPKQSIRMQLEYILILAFGKNSINQDKDVEELV